MSPQGLKWTGGIVAGAAVGGLVVYLATLGWEKAGWVAGVVSMFLAVAGVGLAVMGEARARGGGSPGGAPPVLGAVPAGQATQDPAVDASAPGGRAPLPGSVTNTISGSPNYGTVIQGGTIGPIPPPPASAPAPPVQGDEPPADGGDGGRG